jgi:hypothetical protein
MVMEFRDDRIGKKRKKDEKGRSIFVCEEDLSVSSFPQQRGHTEEEEEEETGGRMDGTAACHQRRPSA